MKYSNTYKVTHALTQTGLSEQQANSIVNLQEDTMSQAYKDFEKRMDEKFDEHHRHFDALVQRFNFFDWILVIMTIVISFSILFKL